MSEIEKSMNRIYIMGRKEGYLKAHNHIYNWLNKRIKKSGMMDISLDELNNKLDELLKTFELINQPK